MPYNLEEVGIIYIVIIIYTMVESSSGGGPKLDENGVPEIRAQDIIKEGYLNKQSRILKTWRR
jgi:hypothetical protein